MAKGAWSQSIVYKECFHLLLLNIYADIWKGVRPSKICLLWKRVSLWDVLNAYCAKTPSYNQNQTMINAQIYLHQSLKCCINVCFNNISQNWSFKRACLVAGSLLVQCSADGSSYHGWLCVPKMGPRSWLVHGPLLHDPHPRLHGLHVPHAQRHIQRGENNGALQPHSGFPSRCNTGEVAFWELHFQLNGISYFAEDVQNQVSLCNHNGHIIVQLMGFCTHMVLNFNLHLTARQARR